MAFNRKLLNASEDIVLDLKPHWWYMAKATGAVVAALVLAIVVQVQMDSGGAKTAASVVTAAALVLAAGWFGARYLKWVTTNFVVTTDRVIFRQGVVAKHGIQIPLDRVNNVAMRQSLFERLLGAGDLTIESAGEDGQQNFSDVRHPDLVQNEIYVQMEANENRKFDRLRGGPAAAAAAAPAPSNPLPPPPPAGPSALEQLEKLDDLRTRGVITQAEFEAKKKDLLDRM